MDLSSDIASGTCFKSVQSRSNTPWFYEVCVKVQLF